MGEEKGLNEPCACPRDPPLGILPAQEAGTAAADATAGQSTLGWVCTKPQGAGEGRPCQRRGVPVPLEDNMARETT